LLVRAFSTEKSNDERPHKGDDTAGRNYSTYSSKRVPWAAFNNQFAILNHALQPFSLT